MKKMKKLKLIYNPFSGDKSFKFNLDPVIAIFQNGGYEAHVFRSMEHGDIDRHLREISLDNKSYYDTVVVSGGDGSISIVVNAMMKYGIDAKLGIIPSGTANDFAKFLGIPFAEDKAAEIIVNGVTCVSDLGVVNRINARENTGFDTEESFYFINVCGAGNFTNISQNIDTEFKNTLGMLAYYIKGLEQASGISSIPLKITNSAGVFEEKLYLFIILNSGGTAGFTNLVKDASISDGLLEFIGVKEGQFIEIASLLVNLIKGDYLQDNNILYFKDSYIKIEPNGESINPKLLETDLDGEHGPNLPVEVRNVPKAVKLIVPEDFAERQVFPLS
ncbi:MAG: YegS/Rv2252/BmrU family lipid kinase [Clostridiales bacterium]|jgi:YegS/Rv2252/BmrU family lipid kinase|nr:YegS/Rv2252/BmrU family lipid kinase [Clostridiales bacterium]